MTEENPYAPPTSEVVAESSDSRNFEIPSASNYASRWARLGGAIIDAIVLLVAALPVIIIGDGLTVDSYDEWLESESDWSDSILATVAMMGAYFGVQSYFWHTRGQSIGKIATRTRIVMLDGSRATWSTIFWKRSVLPTVISNIPKLGNLFDLINVLMIFRSEHNCLHDDMAGTRVIRARVEPVNPRRLSALP